MALRGIRVLAGALLTLRGIGVLGGGLMARSLIRALVRALRGGGGVLTASLAGVLALGLVGILRGMGVLAGTWVLTLRGIAVLGGTLLLPLGGVSALGRITGVSALGRVTVRPRLDVLALSVLGWVLTWGGALTGGWLGVAVLAGLAGRWHGAGLLARPRRVVLAVLVAAVRSVVEPVALAVVTAGRAMAPPAGPGTLA